MVVKKKAQNAQINIVYLRRRIWEVEKVSMILFYMCLITEKEVSHLPVKSGAVEFILILLPELYYFPFKLLEEQHNNIVLDDPFLRRKEFCFHCLPPFFCERRCRRIVRHYT